VKQTPPLSLASTLPQPQGQHVRPDSVTHFPIILAATSPSNLSSGPGVPSVEFVERLPGHLDPRATATVLAAVFGRPSLRLAIAWAVVGEFALSSQRFRRALSSW
jgi:hypothetical protein